MPIRRFRFLRRRMRRHARRGVIFFIAALCIITGAGIAAWKTELGTIRGVVVEGNNILSVAEISDAAPEAATRPIFGPFPGNFIVLPRDRVADILRERFPRIASVSVRRDFRGRGLMVALEERTAVGIYCSAERAASGENNGGETVLRSCFLIDRGGTVFAEAPETEGALILVIADMRSATIALGRPVIPEAALLEIESLWNLFRDDIGVGIRLIVRDADGTIRAETLEGWEAIFALDRNVEDQVVALRELLEKQLPREKRRGIAFIDLRTPGKIFYR